MFIRTSTLKVHCEETIATIRKILADVQFRVMKPQEKLNLTDATIVAAGDKMAIVKNGEYIGFISKTEGNWELTISGITIKDLSVYVIRAIEKLLNIL